MTNEEAYKWLYVHFAPCGDETKQDEAINIALEAIAKQIPKKPIRNVGHINPVFVEDAYLCPICFSWAGSIGFCSRCGQAIDWRTRDNEDDSRTIS